ncbi:MAG: TetR/AcrR family transcriptional regulator [Thermodesulfobacteriota bacterium]
MGTAEEGETPRNEKTRRRIMQFAEGAFHDRGFRGVTVEEICGGLGMSKRTFYKYFANRDALALAIMMDRFAVFGPALIENLKSAKPVKHILETHFDLLIHNIYGRISAQMFADFQTMFPDAWQNLEQARRQIIAMFADLLRRGQAEGCIRQDLDPLVAVKIIQGIATHLADPRFLLSAGIDMDAFVRNWQHLVFFGLLTTKTKQRRSSIRLRKAERFR